MSTETERAEFEAWYSSARPEMHDPFERISSDKRYASMETEWSYQGWRAARAQQAEAEPVAWIHPNLLRELVAKKAGRAIVASEHFADQGYTEPLYTAAPVVPDWTPDSAWAEYDKSIHTNPDHYAWADLFMQTFPRCGADRDTMAGWFANAMMAKHDSMRASSPQPAGGVPDGYVLVPKEPTDEICEALESCLRDHGYDHDSVGELSKAACWDAMLSAAPQEDNT